MKKIFTTISLIAILFSVNGFAQNKEIWGVSSFGGTHDVGCIFKTDSLGNNHTVVYNFEKNEGSFPVDKLCKANNGKSYGLTQSGGKNKYGVFYEYDYVNNDYKKIIDFDSVTGFPRAITHAPNGKIYVVTTNGIFEYDYLNNIFSKKYQGSPSNQFTSITPANGKLYGAYSKNSTESYLYEYDYITNSYSIAFDFNNIGGARMGIGRLFQAGNGKLYGTTQTGGVYNFGFLFEFNTQTKNLVKLYDFNDNQQIFSPKEGVSEFGGKLYWTTYYYGGIFEYNLQSDTLVVKHKFDSATGVGPLGQMLLASNNKFYGTTSDGGQSGYGVIYEFDPVTGFYTVVNEPSNNLNSLLLNPEGSFIELNNGKLLCATSRNNSYSTELIFDIDFNTKEYREDIFFAGAKNGNTPNSKLHKATNGKLYGTTLGGGKYNKGTIFEFDPSNNSYTKKVDNNPAKINNSFFNNLFSSKNGHLYGTLANYGSAGVGFYVFNPSCDSIKVLLRLPSYNFLGTDNDFIMEKDSVLYSYIPTTDSIRGLIYKFDLNNNSFSKLHYFSDSINGYDPIRVVSVDSSNFWGITLHGGVNNNGTLFHYNIKNNTFVKKLDFDTPGLNYPSTIIFDSL